VIGTLVSKLSLLIFLVIAARLLPVEAFAGYSYLVAMAVTISVLADTGVALVTSREIASARDHPGTLFWSALPAIMVGASLAGTAMIGLGMIDGGPGTGGLVLVLMGIFVAANAVLTYLLSVLRALGRFGAAAGLIGVSTIALVGASVAVAAAGGGLTELVVVLPARELLTVVVAMLMLRRDIGAPAQRRRGAWRRTLRLGLVLALASSLLALATRLPLLVVGNTGTVREVAYFSAPQRIAEATLVIAMTVGFALLPGLAYLRTAAPGRAARLLRRTLSAVAALGLIVTVVLVALAEPVIRVLFGDAFITASVPGRILFAGTFAYALLGTAWYALLALGDERRAVLVGCFGLVVAGIASMLPISGREDVVAAWSYLLALTAMAALACEMVRRRLAADAHAAAKLHHPEPSELLR